MIIPTGTKCFVKTLEIKKQSTFNQLQQELMPFELVLMGPEFSLELEPGQIVWALKGNNYSIQGSNLYLLDECDIHAIGEL